MRRALQNDSRHPPRVRIPVRAFSTHGRPGDEKYFGPGQRGQEQCHAARDEKRFERGVFRPKTAVAA